MPPIVSDHTPTLITESSETANSPIDVKTAIMTFTASFIDFGEKAGFRRKRPRIKTVYAATNNIMNPVLINKETRVVWGLRIVITAVIAPAIGTAISQPFNKRALMNFPSPEGVFRTMKRLSFPRTVTSPFIMTTRTGNKNCAIMYTYIGPMGSDVGTANMARRKSSPVM